MGPYEITVSMVVFLHMISPPLLKITLLMVISCCLSQLEEKNKVES